jgi:ABC-2 type transport system permease protein
MSAVARAASAFRWLEYRLIRASVAGLLTGSRLRLAMIAICSAIFWAGLFVLFFEAFRFLGSFVKLSNEVVEYLFGIFFLSLLVMLLVSTGIILYQGLYRSREAAFLLTLPVTPDRVFAHKFTEAMGFSSWGFLLLGSPLLVAYGINQDAGWPYYGLALAFLPAFVLIPGALGAIGAILVALLMPRRRKTVVAIIGVLLLLGLVRVGGSLYGLSGEIMSRDWLDALLGRLAFSQHPLLPSRWMGQGLVAAVGGSYGPGLFYLFVMAAHGAFLYLVAAVMARDLYRTGYSRVQGGRSARKKRDAYRFDALFHRAFFFLNRPVRLLILKDIRTFRRDPAQWSQFLIFFGLLAFYFLNIRRLGYNIQNEYFRNLLSFLNLAVTALILSTFTSRFIFPMLSLEGRNFWILGLFPLRRSAILWGKFAFSSGIALVATEGLIVLSDRMLQIGPGMTAVHMVTVAFLCLGLSGISVGLGARMPNLKEEDPSRIAAGFGGTLNLLVSLVFIVLMVTALALPFHLYYAGNQFQNEGLTLLEGPNARVWLAVSLAASTVLGLIAVFVPLRMGIRAFERMEL